MLPGKKYTPDDFLRILRRRFWVLVVPFAIVSAGTALWTRTLVNMYRAESLIMIVPQRVPESYVRSTVTTEIEERIAAIQQQIMSRTQLERLINQFNLYPQAIASGIMQDVVERMRSDIIVRPVQGDVFRVQYQGQNPMTVKNVTAALADLFINESLQDRALLAENTNQFLAQELENARLRLAEREKALADYRQQHAGELPSQQQANLQAMQSVQSQITSLLQSVREGQQRRILLEGQLGELESQTVAPPEPLPATPEGGGTAVQQLERARATLAAAELRWTNQHPDIQRLKRDIAELEKKAEAEALQAPLSAGGGLPPAEAARQKRMAELRAEVDQITRDIEGFTKEEARLRGIAANYQRRVEMAPTRENELTELTRDYSVIQGLFSGLLEKVESARLATNLERGQKGEQFRLLDQARVPERPYSPDRQRLIQMGMGAGLGIGALLVLLLEYRDRGFRSDDDVKQVLDVPVLAVVPLMRSEREKRRFRTLKWAMHLVLGSVVLVCLSVLGYAGFNFGF